MPFELCSCCKNVCCQTKRADPRRLVELTKIVSYNEDHCFEVCRTSIDEPLNFQGKVDISICYTCTKNSSKTGFCFYCNTTQRQRKDIEFKKSQDEKNLFLNQKQNYKEIKTYLPTSDRNYEYEFSFYICDACSKGPASEPKRVVISRDVLHQE